MDPVPLLEDLFCSLSHFFDSNTRTGDCWISVTTTLTPTFTQLVPNVPFLCSWGSLWMPQVRVRQCWVRWKLLVSRSSTKLVCRAEMTSAPRSSHSVRQGLIPSFPRSYIACFPSPSYDFFVFMFFMSRKLKIPTQPRGSVNVTEHWFNSNGVATLMSRIQPNNFFPPSSPKVSIQISVCTHNIQHILTYARTTSWRFSLINSDAEVFTFKDSGMNARRDGARGCWRCALFLACGRS